MPDEWSPQAAEDIGHIIRPVAAHNPVAALRIARELLIAGDSLVIFPRRGRPSLLQGRRELVTAQPYVIVYRILADERVDILRVWHAAQDR